ncbi:sigma 54-interacting transcriptional regulator [Alicyclobacillus sp. SO9]|uniref:sigma 54-interacting transcriptional regulator n=1 Tax=Alicyclobacillus sp. SO9 TaxID=2665646 RepID=UPI0018E86ED0|nr:sigma 54-interacting transcriptional regulator [Alicyclobacillus sp. SO9]QQE79301.1 sigma 54-interacting transcriptional regulator [Alicyclobacillus sp. SO9]
MADTSVPIAFPYQEFVEHLPNGVVVVAADNQIVYCNERALELLKTERRALLNSKVEEWLGRITEADMLQLEDDKQRLKIPYQESVLVFRQIRIGSHGHLKFFVFEDITVYEQVSEALQQVSDAHEELRMILDSSHDDILIASGEGIVLSASQTFEDSYNIPLNELVGQSVEDLEKRRVFNPSVTLKVLKTGTRQVLLQKTATGKKMLVTGTPILNEDGRIRRIISYSHDVTELHALKDHVQDVQQEMTRVRSELEQLRSKELNVSGLIVESGAMNKVIQSVAQVARHDVPVLLLGESGVGKSALAKLVHKNSSRSEGPFIEVNCGAIPANLIESELFGYEAGAFTGADKKGKIGLVELADNGTLFLDEVAELPLLLQVKLLKVLQDKEFRRVGGSKSIRSDFRLISATNQDIDEMVRTGEVRDDLYYRINTVTVTVPALRDRRDGISRLTHHVLTQMNEKHGLAKAVSTEVIERLSTYDWPGNIRELENVIERAVILSRSEVIGIEDLPESIAFGKDYPSSPALGKNTLPEMVAEFERNILESARKQCRTTVEVAQLLGISQPTAVRKLQKYAPLSGEREEGNVQ